MEITEKIIRDWREIKGKIRGKINREHKGNIKEGGDFGNEGNYS